MLALLSFGITFLLTPLLARKLAGRKITGTDLHKERRVEVPEMGGVAILLGFLISMLAAYVQFGDVRFLLILGIAVAVGALGVLDGFYRLTPVQKVVSLSLVGTALIPYSTTSVAGRDFGILYLLALPILFMCACNFTNMLAGFNGLEAGTGAIASAAVALLAYANGQHVSFAASSAMAASLLAFLYFNRYPARVFPGDVGTLTIGAVLFTSIVFGKLEVPGAVIFAPYVLDAALKYFSAGIMTRESQKPTKISHGKLYVPEGGNLSLPRAFLLLRPMGEKELVYVVWAVELMFCLLAIAAVVL